MKEYKVSDLFFTDWKQLTPKQHAIVFALQQTIKATDKDKQDYGFLLIRILRELRKRPLLVDKINEEQAVDIYNDLSFLNTPWYYFPQVPNKRLALCPPEEHMSRHTFDHFIYADNEYTAYITTSDTTYLRRLLVTLYRLPGEQFFDKESVADRAEMISNHVKEWQLNLVFFTYAHVREFVMKRCKTLLPPSPSSEESKPQRTGAMWLKLKHRLAETPVFQGYDTAGRANMYSALDYLEDLAKTREQNGKA